MNGMQLTGSQIVIECLKEQGVDTVFGYPGGQVLNIYDELYQNSDRLRHVLAAHEQGGGDPLLTQEIDDFSIVSCSHGGQFAQIKRQGRHFFLGGHAAYGAFILNRKRRKNLFGNRAFRRSGIVGNGVPGVLGQKAGFGMPQRRRPCRKSQRNHNQTTDNDLVQHEKNLMC